MYSRSDFERWLEEERLKRLRSEAINILNRLPRYVEGYLQKYDPSINIDVRRDFSGDPLELTIRIYLTPPKEQVIHDRLETPPQAEESPKAG